ncbi:MAG: ribonucleotide-diphosphate reductase subunit alpha [Phycisphaerae bacterium]|nr:MAG: ribonucleotide-diphosphate reductase subunit alpha [Phycisphaerae bacterium]
MDTATIHPRRLAAALAPLLGLLAVVVIFALIPPHPPISLLDLRTVAVHAVLVSTIGLGMTLVVIAGGIDLSVGSMLALACVISALAARQGWPAPMVVLAGVATGVLCGAYNGVLIASLRLPAFIVTLGTLGLFRGLGKWIAGPGTVKAPTQGLDVLMDPTPPHAFWLFAPGVWLTAVLAALAAFTLHRTVFGRHVVAIGSNETAARFAAIPLRTRRIQIYALLGACTGLAGALQFARLTVGDPTVAVGIELEVIAAVVIGGASLAGGTGSILGTLAGAVMMAYLRNRCSALGWPNFVQELIVGHVIIAAVLLDTLRRRRAVP